MKIKESKSAPAICANCQFWDEEENPTGRERLGECKRFPPQSIQLDDDSAAFISPTTAYDDFCGEFKTRCDA